MDYLVQEIVAVGRFCCLSHLAFGLLCFPYPRENAVFFSVFCQVIVTKDSLVFSHQFQVNMLVFQFVYHCNPQPDKIIEPVFGMMAWDPATGEY